MYLHEHCFLATAPNQELPFKLVETMGGTTFCERSARLKEGQRAPLLSLAIDKHVTNKGSLKYSRSSLLSKRVWYCIQEAQSLPRLLLRTKIKRVCWLGT